MATDEHGKYLGPLSISLWSLFRDYMVNIRRHHNFCQDENAWKQKFKEDIQKPYSEMTESMQYWVCQMRNTGR
jgi:hypothetical protein